MNRYEVTVYEKAEHWTFEVQYEADSSEDAMRKARKDYGRGYVVRRAVRA